MADNFKDWLSELKGKSNIVSVISKYCRLVQKGRNYWACCPFHIEKTPSMCIYEYEQTFHCYGCREHGDVIKFVQKIESCDFMQAVEILAKEQGMEVPNFSIKDSNGIEIRKREKDAVLACLNEAMLHYKDNLYLSDAKPAQEYIKKRKLGKKELENFGLGYSLGYTEMVDFLSKKGYTHEIIQKAGLIEKNSKNNYYDVFAYRLIFPLFNMYNECVGFSGRILTQDKTKAKYKNSPNTIVFDKSNTIFGLNLLRNLKQKQNINNIVIVEGQMDVIAMHKAGFLNCVACLGTAFTSLHAKQLKLISPNIIACLDGDSAGMKASCKMVDILAENGFNVTAVKIPNNSDPDEYINEHGVEAMQKLLDNAVNYIDFQIDYLAENVDFSKSEQKAKFIKNALQILDKLSTDSEKQIYLKHIKDLSGVPIDILQQDLFKRNSVKIDNTFDMSSQQGLEDATNKAIKFILASMLFKKDYVDFKFNLKKYLKNDSYIKLYDYIIDKVNSNTPFTVSSLYDIFDMDNEPNLVDIINYNFEKFGNNQQYYQECKWNIVEKFLKQEQERLNQEFVSCKDATIRKNILMELSNIINKLKNKDMED